MSLRTYLYIPQPSGIDMFWTTETHVYHYLICSASERSRIMADVHNLEPGQPFNVMILHRCLARYLTYSTVESDENFLDRITRIFVCELNKWNYQTFRTLVSSITTMASKRMIYAYQVQNQYNPFADFNAPPVRAYFYHPRPSGIDHYWTSPLHLYWHLLHHPSERMRLLDEVKKLNLNQTVIAVFIHFCLPQYFTLSTHESDEIFLRRIQGLYHHELCKQPPFPLFPKPVLFT